MGIKTSCVVGIDCSYHIILHTG